MFALYNHAELWSCTNACTLSGLQRNLFRKQIAHVWRDILQIRNKMCPSHTYLGCAFCAFLCAHILATACATEELKCRLLILFCSRGKRDKEMTWNSECEILFESCQTSRGSAENVCQDCRVETSEILFLWSSPPPISLCGGEAASPYPSSGWHFCAFTSQNCRKHVDPCTKEWMCCQYGNVCFTSYLHIHKGEKHPVSRMSQFVLFLIVFSVASCHRWWGDRDVRRLRPWLVVRDGFGGMVPVLIQTRAKTREETTKQPAGKPHFHLKRE